MKGSVLDMIIIPVMLFVGVIAFIFAGVLLTEVEDSPFGEMLTAEGITILTDGAVEMQTFDSMSIVLMIGLIGGSAVSAFFIRSHPVFLVIAFLLYGFFIAFGAIISNAFYAFATSADVITAVANNYPIAVAIMANMPLFMIVGTIIIAVAGYSGYRRGSNEGFG